jgi:hypothetical protein
MAYFGIMHVQHFVIKSENFTISLYQNFFNYLNFAITFIKKIKSNGIISFTFLYFIFSIFEVTVINPNSVLFKLENYFAVFRLNAILEN